MSHFSPCVAKHKLVVFFDPIPVGYFEKDNRFFKNPPKNTLGYKKWPDRVEKASYWKSIGIYDFLQLSREPFRHNVGLVGAFLYF